MKHSFYLYVLLSILALHNPVEATTTSSILKDSQIQEDRFSLANSSQSFGSNNYIFNPQDFSNSSRSMLSLSQSAPFHKLACIAFVSGDRHCGK